MYKLSPELGPHEPFQLVEVEIWMGAVFKVHEMQKDIAHV